MSAERITMYAERMKKERDEAQLASLETNERDTKIILELRAENARLRDIVFRVYEETLEYHMKSILTDVLKNQTHQPRNGDELFDFLEGAGAREFANAVIADMVEWTGSEDAWVVGLEKTCHS